MNAPDADDAGLVEEKHPNRKHGMFSKRGTRKGTSYSSWSHMKTRCLNPNDHNYHIYGGRGIKICERWLGPKGYANFLEDMGERPEGHSLDRKDPDGNYEPSNCQWATLLEQSRNLRKTISAEIAEQVVALTHLTTYQVAELFGISQSRASFIRRTDISWRPRRAASAFAAKHGGRDE
jgi:hypothetical protein